MTLSDYVTNFSFNQLTSCELPRTPLPPLVADFRLSEDFTRIPDRVFFTSAILFSSEVFVQNGCYVTVTQEDRAQI